MKEFGYKFLCLQATYSSSPTISGYSSKASLPKPLSFPGSAVPSPPSSSASYPIDTSGRHRRVIDFDKNLRGGSDASASQAPVYITHSVIIKHSDQYLLDLEWEEAGGRACLTGYAELGSLSHANLSIGKPSKLLLSLVGAAGSG